MRRAVCLMGVSSAYFEGSLPLALVWQSRQFRLREAAMKPIVAMNSSTGIPRSTWTFLKTSSAIGGLAPAAWPPGAVWPRATRPFNRQITAVATKPSIARLENARVEKTAGLDPSFMTVPSISVENGTILHEMFLHRNSDEIRLARDLVAQKLFFSRKIT